MTREYSLGVLVGMRAMCKAREQTTHVEALDMAISALREQGGSFQNGNDHNTVKDWPPYMDLPREQEERSKKCPYCDVAKANEGVKNTVLWVKEPETQKWTMMGKKLLFCPWCGRKLEEV